MTLAAIRVIRETLAKLMRRGLVGVWSAMALTNVLAPACIAQGDVLVREVISREFSVSVGAEQSPQIKDIVSREFTINVENGSAAKEVLSRELSLAVATSEPPQRVTGVAVTFTPTGESVTLDWNGYNQWAQNDIDHFAIYFSDQPFTDVSGMTPYLLAPGETSAITLSSLPAWKDHFFAIVPVDVLNGFDPVVNYAAAYIITREIVSREVSIAVENGISDGSIVSREISLVVADTIPPSRITDVTVRLAPRGETATLGWSSYNQWAQADVDHYDIYVSERPFLNVAGMTPIVVVRGEIFAAVIEGLEPWRDHFFTVVPVDAAGAFDPVVNYKGAYVLSAELVSREVSLSIENGTLNGTKELVSREVTMLAADDAPPAPITTILDGSIYDAATSVNLYSALDLVWPGYNEYAQKDVAAYRIYLASEFFDNVSGMTPFKEIGAERSQYTVTGLVSGEIYYAAVVPVDGLGNFNSQVFSRSAKASIFEVGEVLNLSVVGGPHQLTFSWERPRDSAAFLVNYRVYFDGQPTPVVLPSTATSWQATDLERSRDYQFRITTIDKFGIESAGAFKVGRTDEKIVPVLTWATPAEITYGTLLSGTQLNAAANVPGIFNYIPSVGTTLHAGVDQELSVTFSPDETANYATATASVKINVSKAPLTITAENKRITAGEALPVLTALYVGFVSGDTPADLDTPLTLTTSATFASPAGNYVISAGGAADADYSIIFNNGTLVIEPGGPNVPPVAPDQTFVRGYGLTLKIRITDLLAACADPDGDILTLQNLGLSAQGATISQTATHILYSVDANVDDSFSYQIADPHGATSTGTINVQVIKAGGQAQSILVSDGFVQVNFAGIPGFEYNIQRSTDAAGPWGTLTTQVAPFDGLFNFVDPNPPTPTAYYRLQQN